MSGIKVASNTWTCFPTIMRDVAISFDFCKFLPFTHYSASYCSVEFLALTKGFLAYLSTYLSLACTIYILVLLAKDSKFATSLKCIFVN